MLTKRFMVVVSTGLLLIAGRPAEAITPTKVILLCDKTESGKPTAHKKVEHAFAKGFLMPLSSYDDDPFVQDANVECLDAAEFDQGEDGRPILSNDRAFILDEPVIYRRDPVTGSFNPFANNPWPLPTSNADGSFRFPDEARFPLHDIERDSDGRPVLRDGLQVWKPRDLHRGMTTAFEAANSAKDAAEEWSGRHLLWGENNDLGINAHAFVDFSAFYSPTALGLFFGVVPYRLSGTTVIRVFEMASSWEVAAHEAGHALHHELKPNRDPTNLGYRTWGESFGDQIAMWTALRDPGRVRSLLAETNGDLGTSNALSRLAEVFDALTGGAGPLRDAVNNWKVSNTSPEEHDRSEVLSGASYRLFLTVYGELMRKGGAGEQALRKAGTIMGTFLTRAADYTPENTMTLEDVTKAYLKVDAEFYDGHYQALLVDEFTRRELFDADSVSEWRAHEAAVPDLRLPPGQAEQEAEVLVQMNLDRLGIGPDFGLKLHSLTRDDRYKQTIVRVQLTLGRGNGAVPLDNHGILTFRANGTLADYHAPLPPEVFSQVQAVALVEQARQLGLDRHGAPLSIVGKSDGQLTVEARVMRGDGLNVWVEAFTVDNPQGERREVVPRSYANGTKADLLERAGTVLSAEELME